MSDDEYVTREDFLDALDNNGRERMRDRQRIAALEEENEQLRETVDTLRGMICELEKQVYPDLEAKSYRELDRSEKVGMIRRELYSMARNRRDSNRRPIVKLTCEDVQADVFNGHPSARHCYDLMRLAGNGGGYEYVEPSAQSDPNYVKFDLDADDAEPVTSVDGNTRLRGEGGQ